MEYRRLGKAGIRLSEVSLGAMTFGVELDEEKSRACIQTAVECGINFIDSADFYGKGLSEQVVGKVIHDLGLRRQELVLSSKVYWPISGRVNDGGLSRKHIFESVEGSLRRLGTDYLDLYFCHHPDVSVTLEETIRAMDDLVHQGKVLYWGTSWWDVSRLDETMHTAHILSAYPPCMEQPHYCMLCEDWGVKEDILAACARHGMGVTVFSPLAQGILSGKYSKEIPPDSRAARHFWAELHEEDFDGLITKVQRLTPIADRIGITMAQLALTWILRRPEVTTVIIGASKPEQVRSNSLAAGERLSDDVLREIDDILERVNPA